MLNESAAEVLSHSSNIHSQSGEDGIIDYLLERISNRNKWCVEFGAWDGIYLSNTLNLIENLEYSAVLIEGNTKKYHELCRNMQKFERVTCANEFVGFSQSDSLDNLLAKTGCPVDFDLLSVDIDGNDYHTINAMELYRPKLICVEFNPSIPSIVNYVQPADPEISRGSSLRAFYELGKEKDYKLVCANKFNAFLVRGDLWQGEYVRNDSELMAFRQEEPPLSVVFSGFDGTVMLTEPHDMLWHDEKLTAVDVQKFPASLRRYPGNYNWLQWKMFKWRRRFKRLLG